MTTASIKFTADFLIQAYSHYRRQYWGRSVMLAVKIFALLILAPLAIWAVYDDLPPKNWTIFKVSPPGI